MRSPKREADQLRPVRFELNYTMYAEGSVLIHMGNTRVLCTASVNDRLPRWLHQSNDRHGWITAEYAMLPRSTEDRTGRETITPKARTQEIKRLIGRSLRSAIDLHKLGERQIIIDCDVIQADGGTRTASVTGGYVALVLAIKKLMKQKKIKKNPIRHGVAAISAGIVNGKAQLDLDYKMDQDADVDLNVVMTSNGQFVEIQGTAEGDPFDKGALNAMLLLAESGISELLVKQQEALDSLETA